MFAEKAAVSIHGPKQTRTAEQSAAEETRCIRDYILRIFAKVYYFFAKMIKSDKQYA